MNKVSGVVYSGLWFFFVSHLRLSGLSLCLVSLPGAFAVFIVPNQHYFALQDALQYPAVPHFSRF